MLLKRFTLTELTLLMPPDWPLPARDDLLLELGSEFLSTASESLFKLWRLAKKLFYLPLKEDGPLRVFDELRFLLSEIFLSI